MQLDSGHFRRHGQCFVRLKSAKPCVLRYEQIAFCVFSRFFSFKIVRISEKNAQKHVFLQYEQIFFWKNRCFFAFFDVLRWKNLTKACNLRYVQLDSKIYLSFRRDENAFLGSWDSQNRVFYSVLKASKSQTIVFSRAFRASGPPKSLQNGIPGGKIEDFALLAARAARKEKCDFYVGNMLEKLVVKLFGKRVLEGVWSVFLA